MHSKERTLVCTDPPREQCLVLCVTGVNAIIEKRASAQPNKEGLEWLAQSQQQYEVVFFNNFAYRLSIESLQAVGMQGSPSIVFLPDMLPSERYPLRPGVSVLMLKHVLKVDRPMLCLVW